MLTLTFAELTRKGLLAISVFVCARFLAPAQLGEYLFLISLYQVISVLGGAGLPNAQIRCLNQSRLSLAHEALSALAARTLLVLPALVVLAVTLLWAGYPAAYAKALIPLGTLLLIRANAESLATIYIAIEKQWDAAQVGLIQSFLTLCGTLYVVLHRPDVTALLWAIVFGAACSLIYALVRLLAEFRQSNSFAGIYRRTAELLRTSGWLNIGAFAASSYNRGDVLLLQRMKDAVTVAIYSAPYRIFDLTQIFPGALAAVILPRLCRSDSTSDNQQNAAILRVTLIGAMILIAVVVLAAPLAIPLLFGTRYAPSIQVLIILSWAILPMFWNFFLNAQIVAVRLDHGIFLAALLALIVNVSCNFLLIPRFGLWACAFLTIATEWMLFAFNAVMLHRHKSMIWPEHSVRLILSAAILAVASVLWALHSGAAHAMALVGMGIGLVFLPLSPEELKRFGLRQTRISEYAPE